MAIRKGPSQRQPNFIVIAPDALGRSNIPWKGRAQKDKRHWLRDSKSQSRATSYWVDAGRKMEAGHFGRLTGELSECVELALGTLTTRLHGIHLIVTGPLPRPKARLPQWSGSSSA